MALRRKFVIKYLWCLVFNKATISQMPKHYIKNDTAQCAAVSAGDLSVRGHWRYTAGIWDEIITALVLIEDFIPGVIRDK